MSLFGTSSIAETRLSTANSSTEENTLQQRNAGTYTYTVQAPGTFVLPKGVNFMQVSFFDEKNERQVNVKNVAQGDVVFLEACPLSAARWFPHDYRGSQWLCCNQPEFASFFPSLLPWIDSFQGCLPPTMKINWLARDAKNHGYVAPFFNNSEIECKVISVTTPRWTLTLDEKLNLFRLCFQGILYYYEFGWKKVPDRFHLTRELNKVWQKVCRLIKKLVYPMDLITLIRKYLY